MVLCCAGLHYSFATVEMSQTSRHLGSSEETLQPHVSSTCTSLLYTHGEDSTLRPKIKQTQKKTSHGTSCLMQESSSSPVICLGTAPSV